jgi:hypothetical protein
MIRKHDRRPLIVACAAIPIAASVLLLDVPIPRSIGTIAHVYPARTWMLTRGTEGQLTSQLTDHRSGTTSALHVVQFERGESMSLSMDPGIIAGTHVAAGDTVAVVSSSGILERLAELRREAGVARATLVARSAGDRAPLVEEARQKVEYTDTDVREKELLHARIRELFDKGYASREEFDISLARLHKARIDREMATAQLNASRTGSKQEDLQVLRTTITAIEEEVGLLERRLDGCLFRSPLSGPVVRHDGGDTLLVVADTSCTVLDVPLRYSQSRDLSPGQRVLVSVPIVNDPMPATIVGITPQAEVLNGMQIIHARLQLDGECPRLTPGLVLSGTIGLPPVPARIYVRSALFD